VVACARFVFAASPIAIDLARRMLLQVPNTYALVVSTENITQNMYKGTQRSMLIPNVLFRVGGAAMLLTNKRSEARCGAMRKRCRHRVCCTSTRAVVAFCTAVRDTLEMHALCPCWP